MLLPVDLSADDSYPNPASWKKIGDTRGTVNAVGGVLTARRGWDSSASWV